MTLQELKDYLLVNSLQYFIGARDIEVTDDVLAGLIKRGLAAYGNHRSLFLQTEPTSVTAYQHDLKLYEGRKVIGVSEIYMYEPMMAGNEGKVVYDWEFFRDTGKLHIQFSGTYIMKLWAMPLLADLDFDNIEFLDMMQGLYLMYVGSARKSFKLDELPFSNDGEDLYSEGKELYDTTLQQLQEVHDNWYNAIR